MKTRKYIRAIKRDFPQLYYHFVYNTYRMGERHHFITIEKDEYFNHHDFRNFLANNSKWKDSSIGNNYLRLLIYSEERSKDTQQPAYQRMLRYMSYIFLMENKNEILLDLL